MKRQTRTEQEVAVWLRRFARAYSRKDLAAVMAMFDPGQRLLVLGSGPDEKSLSFKQLEKHVRRDFLQADKLAMRIDWFKADAEDHVAWFAAEQTFAVTSRKQKRVYPYRFTGVLVKRDNQWRLRMGHLGLVAPSQSTGQSWPSIESACRAGAISGSAS